MKQSRTIIALLLTLLLSLGIFTGCDGTSSSDYSAESSAPTSEITTHEEDVEALVESDEEVPLESTGEYFMPDQVPMYTGAAFTVVHDNVPYFTEADLTTEAYESYAPLDWLGRCGVCVANIGQEIMPTEKRGSIGQVKPTGWQVAKYDHVDGKYLYNRCHLIGYQLTGENANERNLITGTRYLNIEGMLPFENMVADYVKETGNHVLYRATPIFTENNLVADGVLMEGYSVEDEGAGISYCIFAYNVQPGVTIDYATGNNVPETAIPGTEDQSTEASETNGTNASAEEQHYVLNSNTMKFHRPECSSVRDMKHPEEYVGTRDALIAQGYAPCGRCNP